MGKIGEQGGIQLGMEIARHGTGGRTEHRRKIGVGWASGSSPLTARGATEGEIGRERKFHWERSSKPLQMTKDSEDPYCKLLLNFSFLKKNTRGT